jgi:hypothetical protein
MRMCCHRLTPAWDYRVVYEAWVKMSALGSAGLGVVRPVVVNASPSKNGQDTATFDTVDCPPGWGA